MADSKSGGMGLAGVLLVVFIVLKIIGAITWSWWWVLCPLWLPIVGWLVIMGVIFLIGIIIAIFSS